METEESGGSVNALRPRATHDVDTCSFLREGKQRWNARRYQLHPVRRRSSIYSTPEEIRAVLTTARRIRKAHAAEVVANAERLRAFFDAQQRQARVFAKIVADQQRQKGHVVEVLQGHQRRARFFAEVIADQQRQRAHVVEVLQGHQRRARLFAEVIADAQTRTSQWAAHFARGRQ